MNDEFGRQPVTIVEIDQDFCALTYGVSPCTAAVGVTGVQKCFNTVATCQDRPNFDKSHLTLRFCTPAANIPASWQAIPSVKSVSTAPTRLNIGGASDATGPLGRRAQVTIKLGDHPYSDAKTDPYLSDRNYDPLARGTFWTKFLARSPYYQNRPLRIREGYIGQNPEDMVTRYYIIDGIDGPDSAGNVIIKGVDILRLIDDRRTKAPLLSTGELTADIDESVTTFDVDGAGFDQYDESGTLRIGDELMTYDHRELNAVAGGEAWNFTSNSEGWAATNGSTSVSDGILSIIATDTAMRIQASGLSIDGSVARYLRVRIRRTSGTSWSGIVRYATSGHAYSDSYRLAIPDTTVTDMWVDLVWDMWDLEAGGDDWKESTITGIRVSLGGAGLSNFDIDWILAGDLETITFLDVTRGTDGTEAGEHKEDDAVQACLRYTSEAGYLVALDLIHQYAGDVFDVVDEVEWLAEGAFWLPQFIVSGLITEPTGINTLLSELAEQCQFFIWWDEREQKVRLRANRPPTETPLAINERDNIIQGSLNVQVKPEERISQVWVYYGIRNPAGDLNKEDNYSRVRIRVDGDAESTLEYNESKVRRIFSRWIVSDAVAQNLAARILERYRNNPRYLSVLLDAKDRDKWTADIIDATTRLITDETGDELPRRYIIIEAEETKPGEVIRYLLQNADVLSGRFGFWTDANAPDYDNATEEERMTMGFWADDAGLMPDGTPGYQWQ
jgi:hypothetical protein